MYLWKCGTHKAHTWWTLMSRDIRAINISRTSNIFVDFSNFLNNFSAKSWGSWIRWSAENMASGGAWRCPFCFCGNKQGHMTIFRPPEITLTHNTCSEIFLPTCTVGANKKFRLRATVVLRCDHSSKNGRKFLLCKRNMHRLYGFRTVEVLERL